MRNSKITLVDLPQRVEINSQHLQLGKRCSNDKCPISLAFHESVNRTGFFSKIIVQSSQITFHKEDFKKYLHLDRMVQQWISDFDLGLSSIEPITLVLKNHPVLGLIYSVELISPDFNLPEKIRITEDEISDCCSFHLLDHPICLSIRNWLKARNIIGFRVILDRQMSYYNNELTINLYQFNKGYNLSLNKQVCNWIDSFNHGEKVYPITLKLKENSLTEFEVSIVGD